MAMHTGKSLTAKNNNIQNGTEIIQSDYQGLDSQKWILRDSGINGWIISPLSNLLLSISIQGQIQNGARLILSNTQDNDNQMFYMYNMTQSEVRKQNGIYKIAASKDLNRALELPGGNKNNNAQLGIWNYRKWTSSKILYRIPSRRIL